MSMTESENIHATFEDAIYCAKSWCGEVACEECRLYPLGDIFCQDTSRIMAQAMEELVKYRAIGTVSEFKQLKEKATAKKPKTKKYVCPNCKRTLNVTRYDTYCEICCGRLYVDWSEGKE